MNNPDRPYHVELTPIAGSDELAVEVHTPSGVSSAGRLWRTLSKHWTGTAVGFLLGTPYRSDPDEIVGWLADRVLDPDRAARTAEAWVSQAPGPSLWTDHMRDQAHLLRHIARHRSQGR